jgi:hypothetical protein
VESPFFYPEHNRNEIYEGYNTGAKVKSEKEFGTPCARWIGQEFLFVKDVVRCNRMFSEIDSFFTIEGKLVFRFSGLLI